MSHNSIEQRLKRIETRLCKLMEHFGVDPYEPYYSESNQHGGSLGTHAQSEEAAAQPVADAGRDREPDEPQRNGSLLRRFLPPLPGARS